MNSRSEPDRDTPASPAPSCFLYLVRHGATESNVARPPKLQGRGCNLGLSAEGRDQARRTAQLLANRPLAAVLSSPLLRAIETARCIAQPHGLEVTPVEQITEVDVGDWEGRTWREIARDQPEAHRRFVEAPDRCGYVGGENLRQVLERVAPAIERILNAHLGSEIAVVGHNVVNRVYLAHVLGLPLARARGIHQDNCGVNVLRFRDGQVKLRTANAAFHLQ